MPGNALLDVSSGSGISTGNEDATATSFSLCCELVTPLAWTPNAIYWHGHVGTDSRHKCSQRGESTCQKRSKSRVAAD